MQKAKWIWTREPLQADSYVEFADSFTYCGKGCVKLAISAETDYIVRLNGRVAAFGQYPDYPYEKTYDVLDVTEFLTKGDNRLEITVYYVGDGGFFTNFPQEPGLIFEIKTADGDILSYSGTHVRAGEAAGYACGRKVRITGQLGYTYAYDAGKVAAVKTAALPVEKSGPHRERHIQKLCLGGLLKGKLLKGKGAGGLLYDLGKEEVGYLVLSLRVEKETELTVKWGEHISDGGVRSRIDGRLFEMAYKARPGEQEFIGYFRRLGARYLEIDCDKENVDMLSVGLLPVFYPVDRKDFDAGSPLRRQIYDTCVRTLELCMHDHYEDCPWREQALYAMDARNQMLCGYFTFSGHEFQRESLRLMSLDDRGDGLLSICFPARLELTIPGFCLFYIIAMYEYAFYTGDHALIEEFYEKMKYVLDVFIARISGGLCESFTSEHHWNFYEWADGLDGNLYEGTPAGVFECALNALLSLALEHMARVSELLGKAADTRRCRELAASLNIAVNERFYDEKRGLYRTTEKKEHYSEYVNALCIMCGAATEARAKEIVKILVEKPEGLVPATLSTRGFTYDALLMTDRRYGEYILGDIERRYAYMLDAGATSFWETIDGESAFGGAGSLCHGWSALPIYYFHLLK